MLRSPLYFLASRPTLCEWLMRISAFGLAAAVVCAYLLPHGWLRYAAYITLPFLLLAFFVARDLARPQEEFNDTSWDI